MHIWWSEERFLKTFTSTVLLVSREKFWPRKIVSILYGSDHFMIKNFFYSRMFNKLHFWLPNQISSLNNGQNDGVSGFNALGRSIIFVSKQWISLKSMVKFWWFCQLTNESFLLESRTFNGLHESHKSLFFWLVFRHGKLSEKKLPQNGILIVA